MSAELVAVLQIVSSIVATLYGFRTVAARLVRIEAQLGSKAEVIAFERLESRVEVLESRVSHIEAA